MSLLKELKEFCFQHNFKPLRRRGQNFLISQRIIDKIIKTADLKSADTVLEIGAGVGTLTKEIAKRVKKVIAVEIDKRLVSVLKNELKDFKNIEIIQEDIRDYCLIVKSLNCYSDYKVIANPPFNITGLILKNFLSFAQKPSLMVLVLQKEVGERIIAQPPQMSRLSVMVQFYGQPEIKGLVKKNNFWPSPKVDSVILKISLKSVFKKEVCKNNAAASFLHQRDKRISSPDFINVFFKIVKAGFSSPRKYLLNNLIRENIKADKRQKMINIFKQIGLNPKVRAQELSVNDWIQLAETLKHLNI